MVSVQGEIQKWPNIFKRFLRWKGRRRSNFALRKKPIEEHIHLKCHKMSTLRNLRTFFKTCIDLPYSETDCIYNCKVSTLIVLVDEFFIQFHFILPTFAFCTTINEWVTLLAFLTAISFWKRIWQGDAMIFLWFERYCCQFSD